MNQDELFGPTFEGFGMDEAAPVPAPPPAPVPLIYKKECGPHLTEQPCHEVVELVVNRDFLWITGGVIHHGRGLRAWVRATTRLDRLAVLRPEQLS